MKKLPGAVDIMPLHTIRIISLFTGSPETLRRKGKGERGKGAQYCSVKKNS
jgi:hypothetical protein